MLEIFLGLMLFLAIFLVVATKYLLIYHGEKLASVDEDKLLKKMKICLIAMPCFLVAFEFLFFSDIDDLSVFQVRYYGTARPNSRITVVTTLTVTTVVSSIVLLHVRMEYDALRKADNQTGYIGRCFQRIRSLQTTENEQQTEEEPYSSNTLRVIVSFVLFLLVLTLYQRFGGAWSTKWNFLIGASMIFNLIPMILVIRHDSMRKVARSKVLVHATWSN